MPHLALITGAGMLYVGGREAAKAIARTQPSPGRLALGYWLPIVAITISSILLGQPDMAMSFIFATSIASLALVGGCISVMQAAGDEPAAWPPQIRGPTTLLLPAAALVFLAGLAGRLGLFNCSLLCLQGLLITFVWRGTVQSIPSIRPIILGICILLCAAGGWMAVKGALGISADMDFPPSMVPAAVVLSPLLVAPMLLGGAELAQRGQMWASHATHVAVAQLNLCALLPVAALLWRLRWHGSLAFPMANWRIDAVLLIILAAALTPAATGRWRPGRIEGVFFILLYVGYVLAEITIAVNS